MGISLAEVRETLARSGLAFPAVIEQQIVILDQQLAQIATLRGRLQHVHAQLSAGHEPELNDWLTTLALMTMYDKYFTADELAQPPFYQANPRHNQEWVELVRSVGKLMADSVEPQAPQAQARRWMLMLEHDTAGNPEFLTRLNAMHAGDDGLHHPRLR
ncbi:hypothetical protein SME22J_06520 [Serratia marcescens]|nr:hypothetical protein SME22J_06520 [Serratia marcescens]BEO41281.1 hypothetical protein SMQE13_06320 [Serratia marcescens]